MSWQDAFIDSDRTIARRHELIAAGSSGRALSAAVRGGYLIRVMRDHYALPGTHPRVLEAVRVGGRLACISALEQGGVFVFDARRPHIHLPHNASRLRSVRSPRVAMTSFNRDGAVLHWAPLADGADGTEFAVGVLDALIQSVRCQDPWHAVASIDNALYLAAIRQAEVPILFDALPSNYRHLEALVDGRSEAGQETVLRLILREAGIAYEVQVEFDRVGRIDFLVEGILALEADSRLAHDGWERHVRDRWRDLELARQQIMSLRPAYQHTMHHPTEVRDAVLGLLALHNRFRVVL